jgi:hypothetical protein
MHLHIPLANLLISLSLVDAAVVAVCCAAIETFAVGGEAAEAASSAVAGIAESSWTGVQGDHGWRQIYSRGVTARAEPPD